MFTFLIWTKKPWYNWKAALCTTAPLAFAASAQTLLVLTVGEFDHACVISHSPCRPRDRSSTTDSWTATKKKKEQGGWKACHLGVWAGSFAWPLGEGHRCEEVGGRGSHFEPLTGFLGENLPWRNRCRVEINLCGNKNFLASVVGRL